MIDAALAQKLIELADAATQEPWQLGAAGGCNVVGFAGDDVIGIAIVPSERNRKYIAALSPAVVKELAQAYWCLHNLVRLADAGAINDYSGAVSDEMEFARRLLRSEG